MRKLILCLGLILLLTTSVAGAADPLLGGLDPEHLLETLTEAVEAKDPRTFNGCLADSFTFAPYHSEVSAFPEIRWKAWNRRQEIVFATEWILQGGGLEFGEVLDRTRTGSDRQELDLLYTLTWQTVDFRSRATLVMVRIGQRWYLQEWNDTTLETDSEGTAVPTSGEARARIILKR